MYSKAFENLYVGTENEYHYSQPVKMDGDNAVSITAVLLVATNVTTLYVDLQKSNDLSNWDTETGFNFASPTAPTSTTASESSISSQFVRIRVYFTQSAASPKVLLNVELVTTRLT